MKIGNGWIPLAAAAIAAFSLVGCGGGGASGSGGTQVFAQDDTNKAFSHVWVTIDKVTLTGGSTTTTVFDDTAAGGRVVDLRSLWNDQTNVPQFLLLGQASGSASDYTTVNVTLEPTATVVPASGSSVTATFSGASGPVNLSMSVPTSNSGQSVVIDFNLSNWSLNGATLTATSGKYLSSGTTQGLTSPGQHVAYQYFGTVSNLSQSGSTESFTLSDGTHVVGTVDTSQSTVVYNANGAADPALADGEFVMVAGTFDPTTNAIDASNISITPTGTKVSSPQLMGVVSADNPATGSLTIQPAFALGLLPAGTSTSVAVTSTTTFIDGSGVTDTESEFFSGITVGTTQVEATGTLSGGVFQATSVKILAKGLPPEAAFIGTPSNIDSSAGTFDLTVKQWQGLMTKSTALIHVTTSSNTKFYTGTTVTAETTFFGAVTSTTPVFVRGTYDSSTETIAADTIAARSSFDGGGGVSVGTSSP
jgi:hypothetical protein